MIIILIIFKIGHFALVCLLRHLNNPNCLQTLTLFECHLKMKCNKHFVIELLEIFDLIALIIFIEL
jgi:hypothetical protein